MLMVAGIDALRAVADPEILVAHERRLAFEYRHADFLGSARVDRALVDHDVAGFENGSDRSACRLERADVRTLVLVDRRRHGHDVRVAATDVVERRGEAQVLGAIEVFPGDFARVVVFFL